MSGGTWDANFENQNPKSDLVAWMQNYANTLCINCWQVKRYIDLYSVTSVLGFPDEDLQLVSELYTKAQTSWSSSIITARAYSNDVSSNILPILKNQINIYSHFLEKVAELARSKWTEFDLKYMGIGLGVMLFSLVLHFAAMMKVHRIFKSPYPHINNSWTLSRVLIPVLLVGIRANSFLSNSYILKEGKVANFFLATTAIISTQNAIIKGKIAVEEISFLILNIMLGYSFESILSKQNNLINNIDPSILAVIAYEAFPIIFMLLLAYLFYKRVCSLPGCRSLTTFLFGALLSYLLLTLHWVSESRVIEFPSMVQNIGRTFVPRAIYSIGFVLVLFAIVQAFQTSESNFNHKRILAAFLAMICAWSPTIIMLMGRQGPMVAFIFLFGVWCIIRLQKTARNHVNSVHGRSVVDLTSITQWNLLAVSLFFYSGHWCMFDGLRYGAAFIGFDNFNLFRQGALLALDTFGVSHILPIFGLPLLFLYEYSGGKEASLPLCWSLTQAFLIYGFETAATTTFTLVSVAVQRRHLMVWGLFAPKFVFDAVGLILTDFFIFLASLYYF